MAYVKLNTDDLILAYTHIRSDEYYKVFTLVCRADTNKPNSWNLIPSMDITVIGNKWSECAMYIQAIKDVQRYQEYKYTHINEVKEMQKTEIKKFHMLVDTLYHDQKTK